MSDGLWALSDFKPIKPIDVLLDRDDIRVADVLDERDFFTECRDRNPKLLQWLSRRDIMRILQGYVAGVAEDPSFRIIRFQHIATELLSSDLPEIVQTCLTNEKELLTPFFELILDVPIEERNNVTVSEFCKVIKKFISHKPVEMFQYLRRQPSVLEMIMRFIDIPAAADLLISLVQLDQDPLYLPVVDWLCNQDLASHLIEMLSPTHDSRIHQAALDLIKTLIRLSAFSPTPGRKEIMVLSSNRLSREIVSPHNSGIMAENLFRGATLPTLHVHNHHPMEQLSTPSLDESAFGAEPIVSSFLTSAATVMELIRLNNSDYFEQYLFHTAREQLIQVQQEAAKTGNTDCREALEKAMEDVMSKVGLVNLTSLLDGICDRLHLFQALLKKPRSSIEPVPSTVGPAIPLTMERLRIVELYADILHYSNMVMPNRLPGSKPAFDDTGRLVGGLAALNDLVGAMLDANEANGQVVDDEEEDEADSTDQEEEEEEEIQRPAFPISSAQRKPLYESDSDVGSTEGLHENAVMPSTSVDMGLAGPRGNTSPVSTLPGTSSASSIDQLAERLSSVNVPGSPAGSLRSNSKSERQFSPASGTKSPGGASASSASKAAPILHISPSDGTSNSMSKPIAVEELAKPLGERLKERYLELGVLDTLLDLFFEFPWNNLLHATVYDIVHQILHGPVKPGMNRELIVSIFRDVRLPQRVLDAHALSESRKGKKAPRLGFMGHLTQFTSDIESSLERYPDELLEVVQPLIPQPAWSAHVNGSFAETQHVESSLLGGPKPPLTMKSGWGDIDDEMVDTGLSGDWTKATGTLKRGGNVRSLRNQTADFGLPPPLEEDEGDEDSDDDGDEEKEQLDSLTHFDGWTTRGRRVVEDEHQAWLRAGRQDDTSAGVGHRRHGNLHTRDREESGFDDSFGSDFDGHGFEDDFGPFGDSGALRSDADDFGDFQTGANEAQLPSTTGSNAATVEWATWEEDPAWTPTVAAKLDAATRLIP